MVNTSWSSGFPSCQFMVLFEINSFHYIQIMATAAISTSSPFQGKARNVFFCTALLFPHQVSLSKATHTHTKYIIYIEIYFNIYNICLILNITAFLSTLWIWTVGGKEIWLASRAESSSALQLPSYPWSLSLFGFMALCHLGWCFTSKWHFSFGPPHCPAPFPGLALGCHMVQMACHTLAQSAFKNLPKRCLCWQPAWWLRGLRRERDAAWK